MIFSNPFFYPLGYFNDNRRKLFWPNLNLVKTHVKMTDVYETTNPKPETKLSDSSPFESSEERDEQFVTPLRKNRTNRSTSIVPEIFKHDRDRSLSMVAHFPTDEPRAYTPSPVTSTPSPIIASPGVFTPSAYSSRSLSVSSITKEGSSHATKSLKIREPSRLKLLSRRYENLIAKLLTFILRVTRITYSEKKLDERSSSSSQYLSSGSTSTRKQSQWDLKTKLCCISFYPIILGFAVYYGLFSIRYLVELVNEYHSGRVLSPALYTVIYFVFSVCLLMFFVLMWLFPYKNTFYVLLNMFFAIYVAERVMFAIQSSTFQVSLDVVLVMLTLVHVIFRNPLDICWYALFMITSLLFYVFSAIFYDTLVVQSLANATYAQHVYIKGYNLCMHLVLVLVLVIHNKQTQKNERTIELITRDIENLDLRSPIVNEILAKHSVLCSRLYVNLRRIIRNLREYKSYLPFSLYKKDIKDHEKTQTPMKRGGRKQSSAYQRSLSAASITSLDSFQMIDVKKSSTSSVKRKKRALSTSSNPVTLLRENFKKKYTKLKVVTKGSPSSEGKLRRSSSVISNSSSDGRCASNERRRSTVKSTFAEKEIAYVIVEMVDFDDICNSGYVQNKELVRILARYLSIIEKIVDERVGVIEQFQGDVVSISFNSARTCMDPCVKACVCALKIAERLRSTNLCDLTIAAKISVSSGKVFCGNIGCRKIKRFNTFGRCVTFSRLMNRYNKEHCDTEILIDENTFSRVRYEFVLNIVDVVTYETVRFLVYTLHKRLPQQKEWFYNLQESELENSKYDDYFGAWKALKNCKLEGAQSCFECYLEKCKEFQVIEKNNSGSAQEKTPLDLFANNLKKKIYNNGKIVAI